MSKPAAKKIAVKTVAKKVAKPAAKKAVELAPHVPVVVRAAQASGKPNPAVKKTADKAPKAEKGESKADKARAIFERMKGAERKDVLLAFIAEAGLTKAGASTYYQNLKNESK